MTTLVGICLYIVGMLIVGVLTAGPVGAGVGWVLDRTSGGARLAGLCALVLVGIPAAVIVMALAGHWLGLALGVGP